jgi:ribonucleoside-diphosphate reductase alpha chain
MISLWLRAGGSIVHVIKQLSGIGSSLQIPTRDGRIMSLGDGLAQALKRYLRNKEQHGLRALLLGEIDPAQLDTASSPGRTNGNGKHKDNLETTARAAGGSSRGPARELSPRHSYRVKCPECGGDLDMGEGCVKCHGCGYAQC